ncbi:MAG: hypothetical protein A2341_00500 [Deltaproteobacteria bacterium RIFOXYB12_FULL_58_9]|nr:MAG: hypothetical protein A2341_00500 [Deltaproteobacteria bacterium RIFOXYB12_FULL_58_9]
MLDIDFPLFIVNPFGTMETASWLFSTHPATAERVRRLREISRESYRGTIRGDRALSPGYR